MFQPEYHKKDRYDYRKTQIQNIDGDFLSIHLSWLPRYGPTEASLHIKTVLNGINPVFVAMPGICAGDKSKVNLGDLIVAERAFFYDTGKYIEKAKGELAHLHDTETNGLRTDLLTFVKMFKEWKNSISALKRPKYRKQQRDWIVKTLGQKSTSKIEEIPRDKLEGNAPDWRNILSELINDQIVKNGALKDTIILRNLEYGEQKFPYLDAESVTCHIKSMASGCAVREDNPFKDIQIPVRSAIAVDMEGAALYRVVKDYENVHAFVVKGVCDYADSEKDDSYHEYAASISALYLLHFIKHYVTKDRFFDPIKGNIDFGQKIKRL